MGIQELNNNNKDNVPLTRDVVDNRSQQNHFDINSNNNPVYYEQKDFMAPSYFTPNYSQQPVSAQQPIYTPQQQFQQFHQQQNQQLQQQQPIYFQPPPNIIVTGHCNEDEGHFTSALVFFILGFFVWCFWLFNIRYLKSRNRNAKTLATLSVVFTVIWVILIFIIIITSSVSSNRYNYD